MTGEDGRITIDHLQVDFEVDGDDGVVFERLFRQHITRWEREQRDRRGREQRLTRDRAINGGSGEQR